MLPLYVKANTWSGKMIGAAIEVHREKGPGLLESIYEKCLMRELALQKIPAVQQIAVAIDYKGYIFEENLRFDILVENCLLVEIKAVETALPIHKAQALSCMRLLDAPLGLIINFHSLTLKEGLTRLILPGADRP
jgi:GxxExxY protein